ncbi:MAG: EF-P beta-lysylation protein EpmB [Gammaproteobacteria bacterium]|nr:EF-P beta-lysylation protein EpmB [Gammaproteobacteria bacterium]
MHPARPQETSGPASARHWQAELARGFREPAQLLAALGLTAADCGLAPGAAPGFPLRVPRGFVARMRRGDPRDPLLLQVLPARAEAVPEAGFVSDPVGDLASARTPGLLQKYPRRALLVTTGACAVHCRYCFRREYPYGEHSAAAGKLETAIRDIAGDPSLEEIILSGGDPLVLAEQRLESLLKALDDLPHVRRIRLHTRVPVVLPERVDARLLDFLGSLRTRIVVVIHANHGREIDPPVAAALRALSAATGPVLNQSVLLRGVNDSPGAIVELSHALFEAGVMPYYLHQMDPVSGAAHFAVADAEALRLISAAMKALPGYLVPKLVRETPGALTKTLLGPFGAT